MRHHKVTLAVLLGLSTSLSQLALEGKRAPRPTDELRLSVLRAGCSVKRKLVDPADPKSGVWVAPGNYGAWLNCGCGDFLILVPSNLMEHVRIDSAVKALEFVRFFTEPAAYELFDLGGMVEVLSGDPKPGGPFNVSPRDLFRRYCREPTVDVGEPLLGLRVYYVTRPVVLLDQRVYEVKEQVREDGYYFELSRREVASAEDLGVVHFGKY
jgi:hypothetical protein